MQVTFTNDSPVTIAPDEPNVAESAIEVAGVEGAIVGVSVVVSIDHTWVSDLVVVLVAPDGRQIVLVRNVGGAGDDLDATFTDDAPTPIADGSPPFSAAFRPSEPLGSLTGTDPNGRWRLLVVDDAFADGGELTSWSLRITTAAIDVGHPIDVVFRGGLTAAQERAFLDAATVWSRILRPSAPPVTVDGRVIDGVRIDAAASTIDGPEGILGRAGPVALRPGTLIPATGVMEFDTGDLAALELQGSLVDVIVHEMGHVLGVGTLWRPKLLVAGSGTVDPTFLGPRSMAEFAALLGDEQPTPVPLANTGGTGTREGHWRESVFGNELMTGFIDTGDNPLSRVTVASLVDIGYQADLDAADAYLLPSALRLALLGIGGEPTLQQCRTVGWYGRHPGMVPLRPEAVMT